MKTVLVANLEESLQSLYKDRADIEADILEAQNRLDWAKFELEINSSAISETKQFLDSITED